MPSLGTIGHYALDFVLIAMLLSAVKHVTGVELDPRTLAHTGDSQWVVRQFLGVGDFCFRKLCERCVNSRMFKRVDWKEAYAGWVGKLAFAAGVKPEDFGMGGRMQD